MRVAVFGGTFDPVHEGHLSIARRLLELFRLDSFVFIPAFHAPHKPDRTPTSAYHRFAMLTIATENEPKISISTLELEKGKPRYSVQTIPELKEIYSGSKLFFVIGADSWTDIRTWKQWEEVLLMTNHIVVSRPGYEIAVDHVTKAVRERIVDLRSRSFDFEHDERTDDSIYLTDAVFFDTSATEIRDDLSDGVLDRIEDVPTEVAKYIEKYDLY
jgi:nicotinate-nucleotide adenylyltransferase